MNLETAPRYLPIACCALVLLLHGCANGSRMGQHDDPFNITEQADRAYERGDWLVAEKHYKELTRKVPQDAYGWTRLGNIRLRQNKFEGAVHAYRAAVERDPEASRAHYNLATAHLLLARDALQNAQKNLPLNDNGARLIKEKLGHFDALIYEPIIEATSPNKGLIRQRDTESAAFHRDRYPHVERTRSGPNKERSKP